MSFNSVQQRCKTNQFNIHGQAPLSCHCPITILQDKDNQHVTLLLFLGKFLNKISIVQILDKKQKKLCQKTDFDKAI